jgi:molybdopterin synthase catalytic subunit
VEALVYEAYEELALRELRAIAAEADARFGARVALAHRTGRVDAGDPSVAVAASAAHRPAAFAACRYAIDQLKARAPIWKQTVYADGGTAWIDGGAAAIAPEPLPQAHEPVS